MDSCTVYQDKQMPFDIFQLNFPNPQHQDKSNIYKIMLLQPSMNILVIDTQKTYTVYEILSQTHLHPSSHGKFPHQLSDNFQHLQISSKPFMLYIAQDTIYLHDLQKNLKVDCCQFKENRSVRYDSIYEEEYRFGLVEGIIDSKGKRDSEEVNFVVLFWKVACMYNRSGAGNGHNDGNGREILYELKVLSFGFKANSIVIEKLKLIKDLQEIDTIAHKFKTPHFLPHPSYPKPIKLQSPHYLQFTYAFNHIISYQTQAYNLQFTFYSNSGEVKKRIKINSIYNQLVKEVVWLNRKKRMLVFTKHQTMDFQEGNHQGEGEGEHHGRGEQRGQIRTIDERIDYGQKQLFKEDFEVKYQDNKTFTRNLFKQNHNRLFQFGDRSIKDKGNIEEDQRVDIYCIYQNDHKSGLYDSQYRDKNQSLQNSRIQQEDSYQLQDLKLIKLYSSVLVKDLSNILPSVANVVTNRVDHYHKKLEEISQMERTTEAYLSKVNAEVDQKNTVQKVFYENVFTSSNNGGSKKIHKNKVSSNNLLNEKPFMKFKYSKAVLYMRILDQFLDKCSENVKDEVSEQLQMSEIQTQNPSELIKNLLNKTTSQKQNISLNFGEDSSFKQLVLSMLIK